MNSVYPIPPKRVHGRDIERYLKIYTSFISFPPPHPPLIIRTRLLSHPSWNLDKTGQL